LANDPLLDLKTSRIEALSDGVFAIAMTILVLSISVPTTATVSADRLSAALRQIAPQVLVFVISFINLGVLWVGQHNQYHFIVRADRWFLWINMAYLLMISFMPLSTALLGHYPLHRMALMVYGMNLIGATLILALHWHYATTHGRLTRERLSSLVVRLARRRILGSAAAYTIALVLSLAVPIAALALFLVVPLLNILPFKLDRHFRGRSEE
jgi:TMEM175 potassium channel family protein